MKCLKCGTTIPSGQVFCGDCQDDMERHPVKPGTPIVLPNRPERYVNKSSYKKVRKAEDQLANMRTFVSWLLLVIVVLIAALAITVTMLLSATEEQDQDQEPEAAAIVQQL